MAAAARITNGAARGTKDGSKKVATGRMKLPADLPREKIIIEPKEDVTGLKKIGEEITEELERIPGKLFVRQYIRPKYAKKDGQGVVIGILPSRPIDKCIPGPGLLAQIVIDKYTDHIPVHRQKQRFEREGIKLPSSTLTDWIGSTCELLDPLYEVHKKEVLTADYLQVDESPIKVLDKNKKGTTHRGYHWVYHAPIQRMVLFDYREGRGGVGPGECLKAFNGYLQTDGYAVYEDFDRKTDIALLHCMAHARRKFDEAKDNDLSRASYVLTEMQKVYALERQAKSDLLTHEQRYALRQEPCKAVTIRYWRFEVRLLFEPMSAG
ncbi:MAG: IS66 family transposase [Chryseolinea sp.]